MVRYMGYIKAWNVLIPQPIKRSPAEYTALPRQNFIDELVWQKLEQAGLLPSDSADDATFLRRAHLTLSVGCRLPQKWRRSSPVPRPISRTRLIDCAVRDPSTQTIGRTSGRPIAAQSLPRRNQSHALLRRLDPRRLPTKQAVRPVRPRTDHRPGQHLAKRRNGDVPRSSSARRSCDYGVSQLFLGVRFSTRECHHHPFEVWGQGDFYVSRPIFPASDIRVESSSPPISGGEEMISPQSPGRRTSPFDR